jgi:DNA polymerase-3 subunit beta
MQILCEREIILNQLNIAMKAISSHSTLDILKYVVIGADDNAFGLLAANSEMSIRTAPAPCTVTQSGAVALEFRIFYDIVRRLPDQVSIATEKNHITTLKGGKSEFKILGLSPEDFPVQPNVEKLEPFRVRGLDLKKSIGQVLFSVSMDTTKPALMGVLLETAQDTLRLVTVDGFRISYKQIPLESPAETSGSAIVPANTMNEISKIVGGFEEEIVRIVLEEKHILFETDAFTMTSNLIAGEFLNYAPMFSEEFNTRVILRRDQLVAALERVALIASRDAKKNPIKLDISDEGLVITSNSDAGTASDE